MRKSSLYLTERMKAALADRAARTGRSEADFIRAAIDAALTAGPLDPAAPVPGGAAAGPPVPGRLVGIGVGPGDPDLLTTRAIAALRRADRVVAPTTAVDAVGRAETIVRQAVPGLRVERVPFAMAPTRTARDRSVDQAAAVVVAHLEAGEEVAWITLGDPLTYSTFSSIAERVRRRRPATIVIQVPGIMAFQALAARTGTVIADDHTRVAIRTALDEDSLADDLADPATTVVIYKGGRRLPQLAEDVATLRPQSGAAVAGELLGLPGERFGPLPQLAADGPASYLATVIVPATAPGPAAARPTAAAPSRPAPAAPARPAPAAPARPTPAAPSLPTGTPRPRRRPVRPAMISFVGAGPGAPDLITLRGASRLARADVVIWASSLVPEALLDHCRSGVEIHDSATMTLEDVVAVYAGHPDDTPIVRLHSGDPSIYGAIGEQIDWCLNQQRSWEIVPGVSATAAAAAALGRELTQPGVAQSVVLTRLAGRTKASMPPNQSVRDFAPHAATMAVFLSAARPDELADELLAAGSGYDLDTPAAIVIRATWPDERIIRTTVGQLADELRATGTTLTVLVIVGDALADGPVARRSQLYAPDHTTAYRLRSTRGSTAGRPSARRR